MKPEFIFLLTSLMLIGLLGTASMSLEAGAWTQKADMPTARKSAGSAVVDGKIYVIGGVPVPGGITAAVEEYNPVTDTWTRRADMPTAREAPSVVAVDGIIYAIGGWDGSRDLSTIEAYDPATDTWTTKADMPTARNMSAAASAKYHFTLSGSLVSLSTKQAPEVNSRQKQGCVIAAYSEVLVDCIIIRR